MRTINTETKLYQFSELSESAKERAVQDYSLDGHDFWYETVIDDAKQIAALMGWDIEKVYFSGFSSQGDGACFVGDMRYAKNCAKAVKGYAPRDEELHQIAQAWQDLQKRNFYALRARVAHRGMYSHENSTSFDCEDVRHNYGWLRDESIEDDIKEIARDFMRWIYRQLEKEYEYETSAENVAEMAAANEWEYTEDGRLH